jgi:hypothetical protein
MSMHRHVFAIVVALAGVVQILAQGRVREQVPTQTPARPTESGESSTREREEPEFENPFENAIETDRDSFTPSTKTAGRGRLILESAYSFLDNRNRPDTHSFPEFLLRYGVAERLELRLNWNYEVGGAAVDVGGEPGGEELFGPGLERESQISYGFKAGITEQRRWVPESALIVAGFTPTSGQETATDLVTTYVFGWELPNDWKLDSAIRYGTESEQGDSFDLWAPSVVLKVPVREQWNTHIEYFGEFSRDKSQDQVIHFVSPGVHYLVTPDLEVGVRLGWGLNEQSARFFTNVGLGWRF